MSRFHVVSHKKVLLRTNDINEARSKLSEVVDALEQLPVRKQLLARVHIFYTPTEINNLNEANK